MRPGRHLGLLLLLHFVGSYAHVPTYGVGSDGCFTPPHHHDISQVIYLKGSGGLEIHIDSQTQPFDIAGGEILDVDAVFKYEYDQTTYDLFIGCGGCVATVDPLVAPRQALAGYQHGELEPFTQSAYRSVFAKADRKYNSSLLGGCTENHFSIQVRDYHNRTEPGHETLVWGAVIGLGETFTPLELVSFPLYVLRNHGSTWNDLEWTWWVILAGVIPGFWLDRYLARRWFGWRWCSVFDRQMTLEPRAWLCEFAILAFAATMIEKVVHLIYAQTTAAWGYGFWVGLFGVAIFANGIPILIQFLIYRGLYHRDDKWVAASTRWWPLELASGVSWLFLFGAGFYLGPSLVIIDSLFRAYEGQTGWRAPRLDELMEKAGYPPQYGPKDEERLYLRGAIPKRVRDGGGGGGYTSGEDRMPNMFF